MKSPVRKSLPVLTLLHAAKAESSEQKVLVQGAFSKWIKFSKDLEIAALQNELESILGTLHKFSDSQEVRRIEWKCQQSELESKIVEAVRLVGQPKRY